MNENKTDTNRASNRTRKLQRNRPLSKDRKWRYFKDVPNLLQYVSTGTYFARVKVDGKLFRQSLETTVFTDAQDKLRDYLKKQKGRKFPAGTFGEALERYEEDLKLDSSIKQSSRRYREYCIKKLIATFPGLRESKLSRITEKECKQWAAEILKGEIDDQYFNNTLDTMRGVFAKGGLRGDDDPSREIKRRSVRAKKMELLTVNQFEKLIKYLRESSAWKAQEAASMVEFLAYSGCRIAEARQVKWKDVNFEAGEITIQNAKLRQAGSGDTKEETRDVPFVWGMKAFLERRKEEKKPAPEDRVIPFDDCEHALTNGCAKLKLPRQTHHDLRHLFATVCLNCGVDIPTVSKWLGHSKKDGGALVLRVYSHVLKNHSNEMAQKVAPKTEAA